MFCGVACYIHEIICIPTNKIHPCSQLRYNAILRAQYKVDFTLHSEQMLDSLSSIFNKEFQSECLILKSKMSGWWIYSVDWEPYVMMHVIVFIITT